MDSISKMKIVWQIVLMEGLSLMVNVLIVMLLVAPALSLMIFVSLQFHSSHFQVDSEQQLDAPLELTFQV